MRIGGFQKLSLIDYPGKLSSIVFTVGCNLRCPFCYVPQLVLPDEAKALKLVPEEEVFAYLKKNPDLVDAVVITGGEPTLQKDLVDFARRIKSMDLLVALETNGTNYEVLAELVKRKLVDYVAMDVKTELDFEKYKHATGSMLTERMFESIKKSIELVMASGMDYELRTTLMKELHDKDTVLRIVEAIKGAKNYYLQNLKDERRVNPDAKLTQFKWDEVKEIIEQSKGVVNIIAR